MINKFTIFLAIYWNFLLSSKYVFTVSQFEGDACVVDGQMGKCVGLNDCEYSKKLLKIGQYPQHCGFKGRIPIVCCVEKRAHLQTAGFRSSKKCSEYHVQRYAIFMGTRTEPKEFPHMALLGYGDKSNIKWLCGGTLIDRNFVLTAAHCLRSSQLGDLKVVRLGELDVQNATEDAETADYGVAATFPHPNYKAPQHYNDIALVKLNRPAALSFYSKPACLHVDNEIPTDAQLIATGWGKTDTFGDPSSHLLKVDLKYTDHAHCSKFYQQSKKLPNGILDETQICAGDSERGGDTCPGDSGGPLQIKVKRSGTTDAHFSVVGITSFGKACGVAKSVGVYTRVSAFVSWIEDIVWPLKNWTL